MFGHQKGRSSPEWIISKELMWHLQLMEQFFIITEASVFLKDLVFLSLQLNSASWYINSFCMCIWNISLNLTYPEGSKQCHFKSEFTIKPFLFTVNSDQGFEKKVFLTVVPHWFHRREWWPRVKGRRLGTESGPAARRTAASADGRAFSSQLSDPSGNMVVSYSAAITCTSLRRAHIHLP